MQNKYPKISSPVAEKTKIIAVNPQKETGLEVEDTYECENASSKLKSNYNTSAKKFMKCRKNVIKTKPLTVKMKY